jgi:hypothetical protein
MCFVLGSAGVTIYASQHRGRGSIVDFDMERDTAHIVAKPAASDAIIAALTFKGIIRADRVEASPIATAGAYRGSETSRSV